MSRRMTLLALPLLLLLAPAGADEKKAVDLFNGTDLTGWKMRGDAKRSKWVVGRVEVDPKDAGKFSVTAVPATADGGAAARVLINASRGVDLYSEKKFGDCKIEVEFMVPKGSNSGIYVMGEYEVQILDSHGRKKVGPGDVGGLYNAAAPKVNAAKKPGEWQKFVIDFQAPKFKEGRKVTNAKFVKVTLNDTVIHEDVEMKGPTPSCLTGKEAPTGPLLFQGDHGPVAFRNIRITPR
jgi:hypothetical protein